MTIQQLPTYSGEIPALGQGQNRFNQNVSDKLAYDAELVPAQNTYATEANALAVEIQNNADEVENAVSQLGVPSITPVIIATAGQVDFNIGTNLKLIYINKDTAILNSDDFTYDGATGILSLAAPALGGEEFQFGFNFLPSSVIQGSVAPIYSPRYYGDSVTVDYQSPTTALYASELFEVEVDGVTQRPGEDFTCVLGGFIRFNSPPWGDGSPNVDPKNPKSASIDISINLPKVVAIDPLVEQRLQDVETEAASNTQGVATNTQSISNLNPDKKIDEATGIITRVKNVTERVITTATPVTYTLDMSTFLESDEFIVSPLVDAPDITLIVDEGLFEMPDGTTDTAVTLTTFASAKFLKVGSNFRLGS